MKAYEEVDAEIQPVLTSALVRGKWSASSPGRFTSCKVARRNPLDGPQHRCGRRTEEKNLTLTRTRTPTPRPSNPWPVAILTELSRPVLTEYETSWIPKRNIVKIKIATDLQKIELRSSTSIYLCEPFKNILVSTTIPTLTKLGGSLHHA
jgi:hypothetical protein